MAIRLILLPHANLSDPENDLESDYDSNQSDSESEDELSASLGNNDDELPLALIVYDDEDDVMPLARLAARKGSTTNPIPKHNFKFQKTNFLQPTGAETAWKGLLSDPPPLKKPIDFFKQLFTLELLEHVVQQASIFSVQQGATFQIIGMNWSNT